MAASASPSPGRADDEVSLKLICVGMGGVGKSTFMKFWETQTAHLGIRTTINLEFHKQEMEVYLPPCDAPTPTLSAVQQGTASSAGFLEEPPASVSTSAFSGAAPATPSTALTASEIKRSGSVLGAYRLTVPEVRKNFGPGTEVRRAIVKVWDIQGQDSVMSLTRVFYAGAMGALVFCQLQSSTTSLDAAVRWKEDIDKKVLINRAGNGGTQPIPCWLVVNKYDLLKDMTAPPEWATRQKLDEFVIKYGFVGWSYASGFGKGVNVSETVAACVSRCVELFPQEIRAVASSAPNLLLGNSGAHIRTRRAPKANAPCCGKE